MHSNISTRKRIAATGLSTALVSAGVAVATTGSAHADVWDRVAQCESGGNWSINTGNGFRGGLQFTESTWRAYGGTGSAHNASKAQQIAVAKRVLKGQGPGAWPVCSRKAGLTRANGGAASASEVSRSTTRTPAKAAAKKTSSVQKSTVKKYKKATSKYSKATSKKSTLATVAPRKAANKAVSSKVSTKVATKKVVAPKAAVAQRSFAGATLFTNPAAAGAIKTIQAKLGVAVDGIVGPQTAAAIQKYVGTAQDGIVGKNTIRAIQAKAGVQKTGERKINTHVVKVLAEHLSK